MADSNEKHGKGDCGVVIINDVGENLPIKEVKHLKKFFDELDGNGNGSSASLRAAALLILGEACAWMCLGTRLARRIRVYMMHMQGHPDRSREPRRTSRTFASNDSQEGSENLCTGSEARTFHCVVCRTQEDVSPSFWSVSCAGV